MVRRVGIFGGTFDPVHLGHVALVVSLIEAHDLDLVFVIPAQVNPHKKAPGPAQHRLKMAKLAFKEVPRVTVLPIELERQGPSYTIDTVHELYERGLVKKSDTLYLLMGLDQLQSFATWKRAHELVELAPPLIGQRNGTCLPSNLPPDLLSSLERGKTLTPCYDISATEIRERLHKKLFCGHLLDRRVYNYIRRHHLYE